MTYQLHPLPEGLHYQPVRANFSPTAMWYLRDAQDLLWIDLKSVFRVINTTWLGRWRGYCEARQRMWGLEGCCDRNQRETMLAPLARMPSILAEIEVQLLKLRQETAARRVSLLRNQWRALAGTVSGETKKTSRTQAGDARKRRTPAKRKVNAWVVRQAFALVAKQYRKKEVAVALGVSDETLRKIVSGTYPSFDQQALDAWWETFGTQNAEQASFTAPKTVASMSGGTGVGLAPSERAQAVLGSPEKSGAKP